MTQDQRAYHEHRAATQRRMAAQCADAGIARSHVALAELHERRARAATDGRPILRVVMPR